MDLTPDTQVYWSWRFVELNATLLWTLPVDALLVIGSWAITRHISGDFDITRGQHALEIVVGQMREQVAEIAGESADRIMPFVGTLFLYIVTANALAIVPYYTPPTASLSTTVALALCVFVSVPYFGIRRVGVREYFARYVRPTPVMLPFNIIGEVSRTLALAIRLFGNMMSGALIVAILVALTPVFFPAVMQAFGLLTGTIQAYIYAVLATVYIASATRVQQDSDSHDPADAVG